MKLSIFPNANPHPKTKEEKADVGWQVSSPNLPETAEFDNDDELINLVTNYAWSPFTFSHTRKAEYFISCDLLTYDIDDGLTIDEAEKIVKANNLSCLCLPSPSHSEELHKFRLIMPLSRSVTTEDVYVETWLKGAALFGVVDEQCKDLARFYNGSTMNDGFWNEGELFEPCAPVYREKMGQASAALPKQHLLPVSGDIKELVKGIYGEDRNVVPEAVDYFLRNAHTGMPGEWINALNRFCFSLALSGVDEDAILKVCNEQAPSPLDKKDLYQIKRAIQDGRNAKDEEL